MFSLLSYSKYLFDIVVGDASFGYDLIKFSRIPQSSSSSQIVSPQFSELGEPLPLHERSSTCGPHVALVRMLIWTIDPILTIEILCKYKDCCRNYRGIKIVGFGK